MPADRTEAGRGRLSADDATLLLIDHQAGLLSLVHDYGPDEFRNNVLALADTAKHFKLPTILTTSFEDGPNGVLMPELKAAFPDAPFIPRPGLIVGPYDPTDRFTYWVRRIADGGRVLAPGSPDAEVELIDARDLAAWMIDMAERHAPGIYNAVGPDRVLPMGEMLETSRQAAGSDAELVWADEEFLLAEGVQPWTELPVWLPSTDPEAGGFSTFDASKAIAAGLAFRPLIETARDTLAWHRDVMKGEPARDGAISREREAELLSAWKS